MKACAFRLFISRFGCLFLGSWLFRSSFLSSWLFRRSFLSSWLFRRGFLGCCGLFWGGVQRIRVDCYIGYLGHFKNEINNLIFKDWAGNLLHRLRVFLEIFQHHLFLPRITACFFKYCTACIFFGHFNIVCTADLGDQQAKPNAAYGNQFSFSFGIIIHAIIGGRMVMIMVVVVVWSWS